MKQARSVAQATSSLVNAIKGEALDHQDGDMQKRLLGAAQALADADKPRQSTAATISTPFQDRDTYLHLPDLLRARTPARLVRKTTNRIDAATTSNQQLR